MTATKTRQMYVKTRRAFRAEACKSSPVVAIQIDFTSEKTTAKGEMEISNHTVTLFTDGRPDRCTCQGFARWGHCCHIDHFRVVEGLRRQIVVAEQPVQSVESVVALLNLIAGKAVVRIGVPAPAPVVVPVVIAPAAKAVLPATKPKRADLAPLNGNRAFSILKRSA